MTEKHCSNWNSRTEDSAPEQLADRTEQEACVDRVLHLLINARQRRVHFVIADGIVAMEGNCPLNGTPRPLGKIVLADDPVAADATCARLMGFEPSRIVHVREGSRFLGNASPALIDQAGETVATPATLFQVVPSFGTSMHFEKQPVCSGMASRAAGGTHSGCLRSRTESRIARISTLHRSSAVTLWRIGSFGLCSSYHSFWMKPRVILPVPREQSDATSHKKLRP